ncbi:MAG: ABC transporter ATP-binding protein [Deltaproteobacteria bacterium]|jgi:putative ABC transport system ATP-binding protein|nr:ABC transporter ATP-binding protein [Deltaproteobacteria bacterium]
MPENKYILEARECCKTYPGGEKPALDKVSLGVRPGEFLAIMGQSGSGKSTLLNVLSALALPESGQVLYAGLDIVRAGEKVRNSLRADRFAFIFQQHHLMPYLTVLENILLPYMNSLRPVSAEIKKRGQKVLDRVGLARRESARPGQLSGGEQQRVAIARALVRNASILFADEPTGSLDSETGTGIMNLLQEVRQSGPKDGMAVVMVTHNPEYAARAERVIHMKDGSVLA